MELILFEAPESHGPFRVSFPMLHFARMAGLRQLRRGKEQISQGQLSGRVCRCQVPTAQWAEL